MRLGILSQHSRGLEPGVLLLLVLFLKLNGLD